MGNVSNPSINRWGLNTFWYRFWYTDKLYSTHNSFDRIATQLIKLYLHYGLNVSTNLFYSPYWYSSVLTPSSKPTYFRWITTKNKTLGFKTSYRLRTQTTDLYPMKMWILKYDSWVIINFYWFQPNKNKRRGSKFRWNSAELTRAVLPSSSAKVYRKRIVTLLKYNFLKLFLKKSYYLF